MLRHHLPRDSPALPAPSSTDGPASSDLPDRHTVQGVSGDIFGRQLFVVLAGLRTPGDIGRGAGQGTGAGEGSRENVDVGSPADGGGGVGKKREDE